MSIKDRIANSSLLGKAWNWHKRVVVKTKIAATTSREHIARHKKAGAIYVPPSKSASGLHEFSYPIKQEKRNDEKGFETSY